MLTAMRKSLAACPRTESVLQEMQYIGERIKYLDHAAHAAKPLCLQQAALEARLVRSGHSVDKAIARQAEALLAKEAATSAHRAAVDLVAELAEKAASLQDALRRMSAHIQEIEAAAAPPVAMDTGVFLPSNCQDWTPAQLSFFAAMIGDCQRLNASSAAAPGVLASLGLPLQVSISTPKKSKVRARSLTPVGSASVSVIEDSPPPGPLAPLSAYGKATVLMPACPTPYDGSRVGASAATCGAPGDVDFRGGAALLSERR